MIDANTASQFNHIFGSYSVFLMIYGTSTNFFCSMICLSKRLRYTPIFVFLAFIAFIDIIPLYALNFDTFYSSWFGNTHRDVSLIYCHASQYMHNIGVQSASWLKVNFFLS